MFLKQYKLGILMLSSILIAIILLTGCSSTSTQSNSQNNLVATQQQETAEVEEENKSITVYVTETGEKYHSGGCRYLSKSKIPMSLKDARLSYSPCSVCNPPQ